MSELLTITIGLDPNVFRVFGLLVTWHGVFTAVGIVAGVWLAVSIADTPRVDIDPDTAYTIGMLVVAGGLIGARALYVIENYGDSSNIDSFVDIFRITEGGISIYGAMIGGALFGWAYGLRNHLRSAAGADAAAFGMLLGLAIGRIGDIINGEHLAKPTDLPWGVVYTHVNSPGFIHSFTVGPTHPAVAYEMIGDLVILGIIAFVWQKMNVKSGVIFTLAFILYAIMRFFVSFLRVDSHEPAFGLTTPQLTSIAVLVVAVPLMVYFMRRDEPEHVRSARPASRGREQSRAERRRRLRTG
jgi:phosphatidylglycerol:prolipoprotein diacylglycerol transferase